MKVVIIENDGQLFSPAIEKKMRSKNNSKMTLQGFKLPEVSNQLTRWVPTTKELSNRCLSFVVAFFLNKTFHDNSCIICDLSKLMKLINPQKLYP